MEITKNEKVEDLKLEFAALLIHDLETPLAVAKQFIKRVKENRFDNDNPDHQELLYITEDAMNMAGRILHDLMDIAKSEREELTANLAPTSPITLVERGIRIAKVYANQMGLSIDFTAGENLTGPVNIDEHLTRRIIDNLLTNAIRHSPEDETINIRLYEREGFLYLSVANKTNELKQEDLLHLFEPFKQIRLRKEKRFRGFGLGLTFAQKAAKAQNGELSVSFNQSEEVEFVLKLPFKGR